jgi:xylulokinase
MPVLIGIDVGTSRTRALAISTEGEVVADASRVHDLLRPRPGWTEQRPEDWWQAAKQVLAVVAAVADDEIVGLGPAQQRGVGG